MDVTPHISPDRSVIQSCSKAGFVIGGKTYNGGVCVLPDHVITVPFTVFSSLNEDVLATILKDLPDIDFLIIGTGEKHERLLPDLRQKITARIRGVETMDTGAAARTFNVLMTEERRVAAILCL